MDLMSIISLIPHSHQNLSCLKTDAECPQFIDNDTAKELFIPLVRQLKFWCECGITD